MIKSCIKIKKIKILIIIIITFYKMKKRVLLILLLSLFVKTIECRPKPNPKPPNGCSCLISSFLCSKGCGGQPPKGIDDLPCLLTAFCTSKPAISSATTTSSTGTTGSTFSTISSPSQSTSVLKINSVISSTSIMYSTVQNSSTPVPLLSTTVFYDPFQIYQIDFNDPAAINSLLAYLNQDITPCLTNCSNNGVCLLDQTTQTLFCACDDNFTGLNCNMDARPCSNSPCLNNATCINTNLTSAGYFCECNNFYTGANCETQIDLCQNETCSSNGKCSVVENKANCTCFQYFSGDHCEIQSQTLVTIKNVIGITSVIAIIMIIAFYLIIVISDVLNFLISKKERRNQTNKLNRRVFKPFYVP